MLDSFLQQLCGLGTVITAILQMKKPRHKEVLQFAQRHTVNKWSQDLKLGSLFTELAF